MAQCLRVFAVLAFSAAASLAACYPDESGPSSPVADALGSNSNGGGPPANFTPVVVASGEYISPAGYPEARERGERARRAEAGQPVFEGVINGIALRKMTPENFPDYCGDADFATFDRADILEFGYLPPGTVVVSPQSAAVCPDGTQAVVEVGFAGSNFFFEVYLRQGVPVALHEAPEGRVSAATINGFRGVVVKPVTADGYGRSQVAWLTPGGMLQVTAFDLPLDEVMKIAEGIKCAEC